MLRYLTAGESHGPELTAIVEGMPSGLKVSPADIDADLKRRQAGYGRGGRMKIESDRVEITSGVRNGLTLGSPVTLKIRNRDWENWKEIMAADSAISDRTVTRPRPGHADLTGGLKYGHSDLRNILERSSARETAMRVASGALAKRLLHEFGISVFSWVVELGGVKAGSAALGGSTGAEALFRRAEASAVRCPDEKAGRAMIARIDQAKEAGDSLGGSFEVVATGAPPGLGSHVHWDRKLDARLSFALMSIQAIKGVEVGLGFGAASLPGSEVHDEIFYRRGGAKGRWWPRSPRFLRKTNNAGGIEGGMSNGEAIVLRAAMKPIPTLYKPLRSVDIETKRPFKASVERSDVTAVPAAAVIAESVVAFELANAFLEKFGGDSIREIARNYGGYLDDITAY
ncbi:chorismate synthase [bacterium]|nr:chorismate synthase [bacterium]